MSSVVSSVLGGVTGNSGGAGLGYNAKGASIQTPVTTQQATDAYNTSQNALTQQQNLLQALQAQNGINNQSNVYNQLQGITNGTGYNPALAQLAQATSANTANQAALMAGQRGSSANAGLIARQAAQQGAANQQASAGQAATLQAQQSLGALGQMGNLATQQVGQQQNATTGLNQYSQGEQSNLLNSIAGQNQANVAMQSNINNANEGISAIAAQGQLNLLGGLTNAVGGGLSATSSPTSFLGGAAKSLVPAAKAEGGMIEEPGTSKLNQPVSFAGKYLSQNQTPMMAKGGKVPALLSPGEIYLPPEKAKQVAQKGKDPLSGKKVPGKPKYPGNDYRNDTYPTTLQEGGVVIPNAVLQSKNPKQNAANFVEAIMAKKHLKRKSNV